MEHFMSKIRFFLRDENKKPISKMVAEMHELWRRDSCFPRHYITRLLYRQGEERYRHYVCQRDVVTLRKAFQREPEESILNNKLDFQRYCQAVGLPVPRLLAYSKGRCILIDEEVFAVNSLKDVQDVLVNIIKGSACGAIFIKPIGGVDGNHCFRITRSQLNDPEFLKMVHKHMKAEDYIFQQLLIQHSVISRVYPDSINAARIITFTDDDGSVKLISAFMRFGRSGNYLDNTRQGGCFCAITLEDGQLSPTAYTLLEHGGMVLTKHPSTNVSFDGICVPHFEQVKRLACRATSLFSDRLIGWDIAITPEGPVIIEGNQGIGLNAADIAYGGLKRSLAFKEALDIASRHASETKLNAI